MIVSLFIRSWRAWNLHTNATKARLVAWCGSKSNMTAVVRAHVRTRDVKPGIINKKDIW